MLRTVNRYKFYNRNPDGYFEEDCVCRAISTATSLPYEAVSNLLEVVANLYGCDKLCVCCYHRLLEDVLTYKRVDAFEEMSVETLAYKYPRDIIIARIDGHLTCIVKGCILDI